VSQLSIDHQRRAQTSANIGRVLVYSLAEPEPIPQLSKEEQPGSIGEATGAVAEPKGSRRALHKGARFNTMITHRLGASASRDTSVRKSQ